MSQYCFIFARGGSKGIPKKNIKPLCGKPLIAYSIELAQKLDIFKDIIVSTDCEEIASVAKKFGASVPFIRPKELAADNSSEWLAWQHAVKFVQERDQDFDTFVSLPTTAPLRISSDVLRAIDCFKNHPNDIVISYTKAHNSPYFNMVNVLDKQLHLVIPSDVVRRQDSVKVYNITTNVYVTSPYRILNTKGIFDGSVYGVEIDIENSIDIDSFFDFKIAEFLMKERLRINEN